MADKYDFIIVGGGTAGCLLANRLASASKTTSILVVEAGFDGSDITQRNPYERYTNVFIRPELDHGYFTTPQTTLHGKSLPYARGKGLGGSSAINFMVYVPGPSADFDRWAKLVGDQDWAWKTTKERLRRIENFHDEVPAGLEHYSKPIKSDHGYDGPLDVGLPKVWETETQIVLDAAIELGYPINPDLNSGNPIGFGLAAGTSYNGLRITSASANGFNQERSNLTVWTSSTVTKVLFERNKAMGIQFMDGKRAFALKEVVLCAGSIDTPKLMLLSGIGPANELQEKGIEVVQNLPGVGKNLQDHTGVFLTDLLTSKFSPRVAFSSNPDIMAASKERWARDQTGNLTHYHDSVVIGFIKDESIYETDAFKGLEKATQRHIRNTTVPTFEIATNGPLLPPTYPVTAADGYLTTAVILMNAQSRGSITLQSSNPADAPCIDPKYMDSPYDRQTLIIAIRRAMQLCKSSQISRYWKSGINVPKSETDEDIWAFIVANLSPFWHASGTAAMGKAGDDLACVDSNLKVFGVENLRIADLSVCPFTPSNHTQSTAYLIGQAAAEKIISEYRLSDKMQYTL